MQLWIDALPSLLGAVLSVTIPLTVITFIISLLIGIVVEAVRNTKLYPLKWLAIAYTWIFRGTPLLVQLFLVYYGLPKLGLVFDAWTAAIITISLNTGAYVAETFRAAHASIPSGQFEAAKSLSFSRMQIVRYVTIPQGTRIALPPLGNNLIDLVKGTALVSTISLVDLFQAGKQIAAANFEPLSIYTEVALIYLVIFLLLSLGQHYLEKYSSRHLQGEKRKKGRILKVNTPAL